MSTGIRGPLRLVVKKMVHVRVHRLYATPGRPWQIGIGGGGERREEGGEGRMEGWGRGEGWREERGKEGDGGRREMGAGM